MCCSAWGSLLRSADAMPLSISCIVLYCNLQSAISSILKRLADLLPNFTTSHQIHMFFFGAFPFRRRSHNSGNARSRYLLHFYRES